MTFCPEELERIEELLARAAQLDPDDPVHVRLERAVAGLAKSAKKRRRLARRQRHAAADRARIQRVREASDAARASGDGVAAATETIDRLHRQRNCYACGAPYRDLQAAYPMHCGPCANEALRKRDQRTSLAGRRALVTGGRIKIGHALALKLLRDGAEVHVTTRFARDAARRFAAAEDVDRWRDRLHVHGVDFRSLPSVLDRVAAWRSGPPFDILVNNAAQTVWRPPEYYRELWEGERAAVEGDWIRAEPPPATAPVLLPGGEGEALFPAGERDAVGNPLDLRRVNSWVQSLEEVEPLEMVEAQIVNVMVPFVLCSQLFDNLCRSPFERRFVVNVAAAEGQFARDSRTGRHPHTNMAKAALNMLTASSAADFARHGIYMVSADPGWASHEGPQDLVERARAAGAVPPLDMVDAAARLYDPIVRGIEGEPVFGCLLKNWVEQPW